LSPSTSPAENGLQSRSSLEYYKTHIDVNTEQLSQSYEMTVINWESVSCHQLHLTENGVTNAAVQFKDY